MRSVKNFLLPVFVVLFCTACAAGTPTSPPTAVMPAALPSNTPLPPQTVTPAPTRQPTATAASAASPAWVEEFSAPILLKLAETPPSFKDDFSGLNEGWFYIIPDSKTNPHYANTEEKNLFMQIPEGKERKDSMVYNPRLVRKDFVLSFDLRFGKTQPDDTFRFQFSHRTGQTVWLDISNKEDWTFTWGLHNRVRSTSGTYYYYSPESINVLFILQGNTCAVYLNHDPLDYLEDCRANPKDGLTPMSASFHLLSTTGYTASIKIDNVEFWDLDEVHSGR